MEFKMVGDESKIRPKRDEAGGAATIAMKWIAVFMLILSLSFVVSCSGGEEGSEVVTKIPNIDGKSPSETGKDAPNNDTGGPGGAKGEEVSGLRLTAKTRLTYFVNGAAEETEEGFVAINGKKIRYETPRCGELNYSHVTVERGDLKLTYVLIPERRRYFELKSEAGDKGNKGFTGDDSSSGEIHPGSSSIFAGPFGPFGPSSNEVWRKRLGVEEVRGYTCEKFKVKEKFLDGTFTNYTEWLAVDLNHLTIKTEYRLKSDPDLYITRWELIEIKRGPPSPDLFTVPDGYVRVKDITEALKEGEP